MCIQNFGNLIPQFVSIEGELQEEELTISHVVAGIAIAAALGDWEEGDHLKRLSLEKWRVIVLSGAFVVLVVPKLIQIGKRKIEEISQFFRVGVELEEAEGIEDLEEVEEELEEIEDLELEEELEKIEGRSEAAAAA